jgi:hypothetical protein
MAVMELASNASLLLKGGVAAQIGQSSETPACASLYEREALTSLCPSEAENL